MTHERPRRLSFVRIARLLCPLTLTFILGCADTQRPLVNIVFISIDSLRADHLRCYGYSRPTSPSLDRIAREGALFESVIAESSWTLPTHISMLTGLSSYVHGVEQDQTRLAARVPTLASRLREEGYRTKGIYSGPYLRPVFGFAEGFDEYEGVYGMTALEEAIAELDSTESQNALREADALSHRTVTSPAITEKAIDFISRDRDAPFFLFLHYFDVHYDYIPPEPLWREFDPDYDGELSGDNFRKDPAIHPDMSSEDLEHLIALYDAEILFTDQYIGQLLDALDRNGLGERTLLVVTADHGEEFFEHGNKGHRFTLHDEVLKVPLLLRQPGRVPAGLRVREQVQHVDFMPTILSLLDITLETTVSGMGVAHLLDSSGGEAPRTAISRLVLPNDNVSVSARTKTYKYLVNQESDRRREVLYDLVRDPGEQEPVTLRLVRGTKSLSALDGFRKTLMDAELREVDVREAHGGARNERVEVPDDVEEQLRSLGYVP